MPAAYLRCKKSRSRLCPWRLGVCMVTVPSAGALAETASDDGEKLQVALRGRPLQARLTVPLKLLVGATLMVAGGVAFPATTVTVGLPVLKPKVAGPLVVVLLEIPP